MTMLDLRDNVSLWGPPPSASRVLASLSGTALAGYPGVDGAGLLPVLARYLGVSVDEIALGCGSDELIDLAFRTVEPGSRLVCPAPTFSMVARFAASSRLVPAPALDVPSRPMPLEAVRDPDAAIVYLCSPNNPTGLPLREELVRAALARTRGLVILDQAYIEFADEPSYLAAVRASSHCLITRTFSKAWGLAGLRLGYAIGAPAIIARLRAMRGPYSVNAVAEAVAAAAITEDAGWMRARAREVVEVRERLIEALKEIGMEPLPSKANFILVPTGDAPALASRLREAGVAVRAFESLPGIGDAIRAGLGPWPLMERFVAALQVVGACA